MDVEVRVGSLLPLGDNLGIELRLESPEFSPPEPCLRPYVPFSSQNFSLWPKLQ